jgi:sialate O-acetylesterase
MNNTTFDSEHRTRSGLLTLSSYILLYLLVLCSASYAAVELPAVIGNHMVLQTGEPVNFWGWADEAEKIEIRQDGKVIGTSVGQGKDKAWRVQLPPIKAGPVLDIQVVGSNSITVMDILAGEVWLCSGQSNMQMTMEKNPKCSWSGGVVDHAAEVAAATDSQLRVFIDTGNGTATPQSRPKGEWIVCSPEAASNFSATAYYLGQTLRSELKVPVGLVVTTVGGTYAEAWTAKRTLDADPAFKAYKEKAIKLIEELGPRAKEDQQTTRAWNQAAEEAKKKNEKPPEKPVLKLTPEQGYAYSDASAIVNSSALYNGKIYPLAPYNIK